MRGLRIILDKSVVHGLNNKEIDSLDRYFFQIVPPILVNEILADLTKDEDHKAQNRIAANMYRVSGNHGLTMDCRTRIYNSLLGRETEMNGSFLPANEILVETISGSLATIIETPLEDENFARWSRREFSSKEIMWAKQFRTTAEQPLNPKLHFDIISESGISIDIPQSDEELLKMVDEVLFDKRMQPLLLIILANEFGFSKNFITQVKRYWIENGKKHIKEFAPYAFFVLKANLLWHLGHANGGLFKSDKNDRKDLEYCYYLPNTQIFASGDEKHHRLMPALLRPDQSIVDRYELKQDLQNIAEGWENLTIEEQISLNSERGNAPSENENSLIYQLWKKHDGEISVSSHRKMLPAKLVAYLYRKGNELNLRSTNLQEKNSTKYKKVEGYPE